MKKTGMDRDKQHLRIERKHPRVEAVIGCAVGLPNSDLSAGHIQNLSEGGLKFSCDRNTIHNILPEKMRTPGSVADIVVEIHFELQLPDLTTLSVKCSARLIHFERLAQDNYHVGLQFNKMDKTVTKALHAHIGSTLEKQHT